MESTLDHAAVATLRSFFEAMHSWGMMMIEHHRSLDWGNVDEVALENDRAGQRRELEAIFEEHCEVGRKAKRLRDTGLAFDGDSPEYDSQHELIMSVFENGGSVVVETKQTHKLRWRFRYELVLVDGRWKIRDNKKRSSDKNPTWRPDML